MVINALSVWTVIGFCCLATIANFGQILTVQGMHWMHTIIVVIAASFLNKSGQLTGGAAVLVILLILGLSAMLDGNHVGREFSLLGVFLVSCAIIIGYIPGFLWASVVLAIIFVIASLYACLMVPFS